MASLKSYYYKFTIKKIKRNSSINCNFQDPNTFLFILTKKTSIFQIGSKINFRNLDYKF